MASKYGINDIRAMLSNWRASKSDVLPNDQGHNINNNDNDLSLLLENVVIPKLVSGDAHISSDIFSAGDTGSLNKDGESVSLCFTNEDVLNFARFSLENDPEHMIAFIEQSLDKGHCVESVYLNLLAPAARHLGAEWEDDNCDCVDVTMGLWRIQELLRELTVRIPPKTRPFDGRCTALFSSMVGDQHSFGTLMIAEYFQRSGWHADAMIDPGQSDLTHKVATCYFDLLGITISNSQSAKTLSQLVRALRAVSKNPNIIIMIGGREVNDNPQLVQQSGADASALDAAQALIVANELVPIKADAFEQLV